MTSTHASAWMLASLVTVVLLLGIWAESTSRQPSGDADLYHARVRAGADQLPYRIGDWAGTDVDPPESSIRLLKPNILLGRRYVNEETGETALLVIVQCQDARDMRGHYPPNCYPAHGWTERSRTPVSARVQGLYVEGAVYGFTKESHATYDAMQVYNFFVYPDGRIEDGVDGGREVASDRRARVFGAGQVQVVFGSSMSRDRMDEVFRLLVSAATPIIRVIQDGGLS